MVFRWPPTRDMGGVLTLTGAPSVSEYQHCGFSFIVPFASGAIGHLLQAGVKVIPTSGRAQNRVWPNETNVVAYFIGDELSQGSKCGDHKCTPEELTSFYRTMKGKTSKPIGSIWVAFPPDSYYSAINQMDFAMFDCYPYKTGYTDQWALDRMNNLLNKLQTKVTVPTIIIAQAEDASSRLRAPRVAGVQRQHDFWYEAGFPICWYSWGSNGTEDIARNFQTLMHDWYFGVDTEETITDETIVHTCTANIAYQVSSYADRNEFLGCPYCGLDLGVSGILGSTQIVDEPVEPGEYITISGQKVIKPLKMIRAKTHLWDTYTDAVFGIWDNKLYHISTSALLSEMTGQGVLFDYPPFRYDADVAQYHWTGISLVAGEFPNELLYEETITTKTIICSNCGSSLQLTISSISEKNVEQYCPVCGEPAD